MGVRSFRSDSQTSGTPVKLVPPFREDIAKALKDFDFTNIAHKSVTDLTELFGDYRKKEHSFIYLGHFGINDYGFGRQ
jgi:hypothetical protein